MRLRADNGRMLIRCFAIAIWAAVAVSVIFWGGRFVAPAKPVATATHAQQPAHWAQADFGRLFGADAPALVPTPAPVIAESSRLQLLGVVAQRQASQIGKGIAVIAVDGKPARAYEVGAIIDGRLRLREVQTRSATIEGADGGGVITLTLPGLPMAAAGLFSSTAPPPTLARSPSASIRLAVGARGQANADDPRYGTAPNALAVNPSEMLKAGLAAGDTPATQ